MSSFRAIRVLGNGPKGRGVDLGSFAAALMAAETVTVWPGNRILLQRYKDGAWIWVDHRGQALARFDEIEFTTLKP